MKIGIDIVEVRRIARLVKDSHFLARVYSSREIKYCRSKKNFAQHFAVRFATKEAVWKALGKDSIPLKAISVSNRASGKPEAIVQGKKRKDIDISLSHTDEYAVAVALIK